MQALSLEGLCELRASKGASKGAEPALVSICRRHADYTAHLPWDDSCGEAGATKAAAAAAGPPPVTVALLYRPSHKQEPLFKAAGLHDAKAFYDAQQATAYTVGTNYEFWGDSFPQYLDGAGLQTDAYSVNTARNATSPLSNLFLD